ncbi:MAG: type III pantothenate kinase [Bacteroidaceae bacterium]|nr:type III pantothenate kinase [Bacteroidaceae bacterium]
MNLIIDIGNSSCKSALFEEGTMKAFHKGNNTTIEKLDEWNKTYKIEKAILSSVIEIPETIVGQMETLSCRYIHFNAQTKLPIKILYRTPHTLGADRIAAVVGAQGEAPQKDILVIDAGSAITYDFLDAQGNYHGGNIAPGINMRLTALHEYTDKLPLVSSEGDTPAMGYDTETAIRSGVINGIKHEIEGYISETIKKYPSLLVFLTGGDEKILINNIKSRIFADEYLVLKGLNRILTNHGTI